MKGVSVVNSGFIMDEAIGEPGELFTEIYFDSLQAR